MELRLGLSDATLKSPVRAAEENHTVRSHIFFAIKNEGVCGLGEVSPQSTSLNGDPSVTEVLSELKEFAIPQFQEVCSREGSVPSWTRIARFAGPRPSSYFAVALIEMAVLDYELRKEGQKILDIWPSSFETPSLSTVSILDNEDWTVNENAHRVRVKTSPGEVSKAQLSRLRALSKPVILDFNCSARSDEDILSQVAVLEDIVELVAIEQPFAAGNVVDHARLAEQLKAGVSLDEGVRSIRDIEQIARYSAARLVCVKPARVGGLANARTIVAKAHSLGIDAYIGGFFETMYGRNVHRHLANASTDEPSDIAEVLLETGQSSSDFVKDEFSFGLSPSEGFINSLNTI